MRKHIQLILGILLLALVVGCKSSKEASSAMSEVDIAQKNEAQRYYTEMIEAYGSWETVVANGSVAVEGLNSSFELRMIRNEAIQLSLRPLLGIEVARLIITQEKLYLYDKMSKRCSTAEIASLQEKLPIPLTLNNIQSILLGKPFILGSEDITADNLSDFDIDIASPQWMMTPKATSDRIAYTFDMENTQLNQIIGGQITGTQRFECRYSDYDVIAERIIPTVLKAVAKSGAKSYSADIYYNAITFNTPTSIDSNALRNYSEADLMDLVKSFAK